jgi:putative toxin-antitoxin system antitoxin component (TIGR02293 family)
MASTRSRPLSVEKERESADVAEFVDLVHSGKPGAHSYVTLLGLRRFDSAKLLKTVERGISVSSLTRFQRNIDLPQKRLLEVVQIPQRTMTRRRKEGRLRPDESDRLLRASRLFGRVIELFEGDAEAARRWLSSPQTVLGGAIPWDLAKTELGSREVEAAIGRIEHGVFA